MPGNINLGFVIYI